MGNIMITQLNPNTFWHDASHILICWDQFRSPLAGLVGRNGLNYWEHAHLVLTRVNPWAPGHLHDPTLLFVNKMRAIWLNEYQPDLNQIFDEYQIVDNGWRGSLRVSECDLAYWLLQCGS